MCAVINVDQRCEIGGRGLKKWICKFLLDIINILRCTGNTWSRRIVRLNTYPMSKTLLIFLPVLLCMSRLIAQSVTVSPSSQDVGYNGTTTVHVGAGGARYYANVTGGLVITDEGEDKTFLATDEPSFTVRSASGGGEVTIALASDPDVVVATTRIGIIQPPLGPISGNTCIPSTGTQTYSVPAVLGVRYHWEIVAGAEHTQIVSGENSSAVMVQSTGGGSSVLRVYAYFGLIGTLCNAPSRQIEIRKTFTLPSTDIITGPACMDASTLGADSIIMYGVKPYLGTYNSKAEYVWTITPGLEELYRSADGSTIFLKVRDTSVDQTVSVNVGATCNGTNNILTKTLNSPAPIPTFASGSFCISDEAGAQATFSVANNPEGKFTYRWVVPDNWEKVSANGLDSTQVTLQFNDSGTGNITVVASRNGCGAQLAAFGINRYPAVAPPITGSTCVAFGDSTPLTYSIQGGANTYDWEVLPADAGWTVASGNGPSIVITPSFGNLPANGMVEIRATIQGDCGAAPVTSSQLVKAGPDRPVAINGSSCVPYGTPSVTYSIAEVPRATGYQWIVPPTWSVTGNTNGTSLTVSPNNTNGVLRVLALGCSAGSASEEAALTVTMGPTAPGAPAGPVCVAHDAVGMIYSVSTVANAVGYQWEAPPGWSYSTSEDQRSITITATNNIAGSIRVRALGCNANANSEFSSLPIAVGPAQPGIITGPSCLTPGQSGMYSVVPVANATGYEWNLPAGWTIQSPGNTASVVITPGSTGGVVSVRARGCNGDVVSAAQQIQVTVAPAQPGVISYYVDGNTSNTCIDKLSSHTVTFSTGAVPGASSYTWTFPPAWGANPVTTTDLSVTTQTDVGSGGAVAVTANGVSGCNSAPRTLEVVRSGLDFCISLIQLSSQYKFYFIDETAVYNGTVAYIRWFSGANETPSAQGPQEYGCPILTAAGYVRVEITDTNGCITTFEIPTSTEAGTSVCNYGSALMMARGSASARTPGVDGESDQDNERRGGVKIFPNPASADVNIVLPARVRQATIFIYSMNGTQVAAVPGATRNRPLDVSSYTPGTYYVVATTDSGVFYSKFVVRH
jgi:hypothetical protein